MQCFLPLAQSARFHFHRFSPQLLCRDRESNSVCRLRNRGCGGYYKAVSLFKWADSINCIISKAKLFKNLVRIITATIKLKIMLTLTIDQT